MVEFNRRCGREKKTVVLIPLNHGDQAVGVDFSPCPDNASDKWPYFKRLSGHGLKPALTEID
jgi:hypothetical protein